MSAVPSAEPSRVADHGRTSSPAMLLVTTPRRRRPAAGCSRASARAAIRRIQALMLDHGITPGDLGAAYALHRISALMREHRISIDELRGDALAAAKHEVQITHCPSVDHDPRYQLPPGARVVGPFTSEWNRLRGGGR